MKELTPTDTKDTKGKELRTLPEGWARTRIGDSLKIVRGISFPKDAKTYESTDGYVACLRTTNVQQEVEWDDLWFVPESHVKRDEQIVQPFDILISTANSLELVGKVALVKGIPYHATLEARPKSSRFSGFGSTLRDRPNQE
jgi:type I restriction enzyme S subunit